MTRLPNWQYRGSDPDGYMKRDEVVAFLRQYARSFDAPVEEESDVRFVSRWANEWCVITDREAWLAANVVIATGHCHEARVPACAKDLSRRVLQLSTLDYRNPSQIPEGRVLVVGASASGVQVAGRVLKFDRTRAEFANDLGETIAEADRRMHHILDRVDRHIEGHGANRHFPVEAEPRAIDVRSIESVDNVDAVLWATGYKRSYPWLHAPVLDANGEIRHTRGRTPARGLYVLGLQFMTRRNSSLLDGVGRDAEEIAAEIASASARKEAA